MTNQPRVLVLDIETAPIEAWLWQLKEQFVSLPQLKNDWFVMAWGAKWLGDPPSKVMYADQRGIPDKKDDRAILTKLWPLLDKADILMTQNGKAFDWPKLKARYIILGIDPPSHFEHVDLYKELKGVGFTSHSLKYISEKVNKKFKKLSHGAFPGLSLWTECLANKRAAWDEMKTYNIHDVLSTEEVYLMTSKWMPKAAYKLTHSIPVCHKCGGKQFLSNGKRVITTGAYRRLGCKLCGEPRHEPMEAA